MAEEAKEYIHDWSVKYTKTSPFWTNRPHAYKYSYSDDDITFLSNFRQYRNVMNMSQNKTAKLLGVSSSTASCLDRQVLVPSYDLFQRIKRLFLRKQTYALTKKLGLENYYMEYIFEYTT